MNKLLILLFVFLISTLYIQAKTDKNGYWMEFEFSKKISKKFQFSVIPEFRFQDQFQLDEYMIDGALSYEPFKFLEFSGEY